MNKIDSSLFTSDELSIHIVDTFIDHGLVEKDRFEEAVKSVKWELDAQQGIGRIILKQCVSPTSAVSPPPRD
jgi:hypothetical protein